MRTPFHAQSLGQTDVLKVYQRSKCYLSCNARHALNLFLKSKGSNKTIYVPDFICRDLLSVFFSNKMTVKFFTLNRSLDPIFDLKIDFDFLLMINYFGFPQDLLVYNSLARQKGAILIEDNAHGLFSRDWDNRLLGSRGDIGILSPRKSISLPHTGALLINKKGINLKRENPRYYKENFRDFCKKSLKKILQYFPAYFSVFLLNGRNFIRKIKTGNSWDRGDPEDEYNLPPNLGINKRFEVGKLPVNMIEEIKYRRKAYFLIDDLALKMGVPRVYSGMGPNVVPYCYPYFCDGDPKALALFEKEILRRGFFSVLWPSLPASIETRKLKPWYSKIKIVQFQW